MILATYTQSKKSILFSQCHVFWVKTFSLYSLILTLTRSHYINQFLFAKVTVKVTCTWLRVIHSKHIICSCCWTWAFALHSNYEVFTTTQPEVRQIRIRFEFEFELASIRVICTANVIVSIWCWRKMSLLTKNLVIINTIQRDELNFCIVKRIKWWKNVSLA